MQSCHFIIELNHSNVVTNIFAQFKVYLFKIAYKMHKSWNYIYDYTRYKASAFLNYFNGVFKTIHYVFLL